MQKLTLSTSLLRNLSLHDTSKAQSESWIGAGQCWSPVDGGILGFIAADADKAAKIAEIPGAHPGHMATQAHRPTVFFRNWRRVWLFLQSPVAKGSHKCLLHRKISKGTYNKLLKMTIYAAWTKSQTPTLLFTILTTHWQSDKAHALCASGFRHRLCCRICGRDHQPSPSLIFWSLCALNSISPLRPSVLHFCASAKIIVFYHYVDYLIELKIW